MNTIISEECKNDIASIKGIQLKDFYAKIENISRTILEQCFGNIITFPIDVKEIAKKLEIEICERTLNFDIGFQLQKISGYTRKKDGIPKIYIDSKDNELTKRYVIAHELSHCILQWENTDSSTQYCIEPFFPEEEEELLTDIMTTCLLFPRKPVLECMHTYAESLKSKNEYPLNGANWLNYLSRTAEVSYYHTISCYQYVRHYMYALKDNIKTNDCYTEFFKK